MFNILEKRLENVANPTEKLRAEHKRNVTHVQPVFLTRSMHTHRISTAVQLSQGMQAHTAVSWAPARIGQALLDSWLT